VGRRASPVRAPAHRRRAVDERRAGARPGRQAESAPGRRRHVVPCDPRVPAGGCAAPDPLEVHRQDRAPHGAPVRRDPAVADGDRAEPRGGRLRRCRRVRGGRRLRRLARPAGHPRRSRPRGRHRCGDPAGRAGAAAGDPDTVGRVPAGAARRMRRHRRARAHDAPRGGVPAHRRVVAGPVGGLRGVRLAGDAVAAAAGGARLPRRHGRDRRALRRARPPSAASARQPHRADGGPARRPRGPPAAGGADMSMGPERMPRAPRVIGALYVLAMAALAGLAAWPIYRSGDFVLVAAAAAILALAIAAAATRWRWPGWITALTAAAAFLVAGVVLAVPARRGDLVQVPAALRDVLAGAVTGFKDLVTVELPVGGYRNLLVPALLVFLVGTLAALLLSWRDARA